MADPRSFFCLFPHKSTTLLCLQKEIGCLIGCHTVIAGDNTERTIALCKKFCVKQMAWLKTFRIEAEVLRNIAARQQKFILSGSTPDVEVTGFIDILTIE